MSGISPTGHPGGDSPAPIKSSSNNRPLFIAGIGASAGGLEALERLFERMPAETGIAFVVIQHLSPDFKSLTDEILARCTSIPIHRVADGMEVQPNAIYLLPPKKDMIITGGKLLLTDKTPGQGVSLPIDHFFRSLAQEMGQRSVAIVLSGTGSDGSRGVKDISEVGGLVIAQSADTAKFDGMPRSSMETGTVDLELAPEAMPDALLRHVSHPQAKPEIPLDNFEHVQGGLPFVLRLLRDSYGIDFSLYRHDTVTRRIERRLALGDFGSIEEYGQRLAASPVELNHLYKDLLIGVTRFFRDEDAFTRLGQDVLPNLLNRITRGEELRVWVAGCATGEEAYSLAILIQECMEKMNRVIPVKIFATDAHRLSLDVAGTGCYGENSIEGVSQGRFERWFARTTNGCQIIPDIRKMIVFAQHNVLKDAPFTKVDLVTCRNLLIYFQTPAQKKALTLFHFALKTGGILFLGPSETTGELSDEFESMDGRWKIFRKRRDIRLPTDLRMSPNTSLVSNRYQGTAVAAGPVTDPYLLGTYDTLLDEFMPPGLLVNETREVIQSFGGASKFLRLRDGRISTDLLEMVEPPLRMALVGALPRVFKDEARMVYRNLHVDTPSGSTVLDITVRPVRNRRGGVPHALIQIHEQESSPHPDERTQEIDLSQASRDHILTLESELRQTKENLQAMIEELETSNEELQATNEELVAANEELQSTNEELHSVNEELHTVNAEYQRKITELTDLSTDMDNLLLSTEIHTIFLDRNLQIRKFTPKIAETFNLLPQDIGRRIDNFTYTIDHPGLIADLQSVLNENTTVERQVKNHRGHWYLMRVLPYRSGLSIDGVVLTLMDLDQVKQMEADARRKNEQMAAILRNSPNWVFLKDFHGRYLIADESFKRGIGCDPVGKTAHNLFPRELADLLSAGDQRVLTEGIEWQSEMVFPREDGLHTFLSIKFPLRDDSGRVIGLGGICTDVTRLKLAEQAAQEAVHQRDRFIAVLSHELRNPLAAVLNAVQMVKRVGPESPEAPTWNQIIERRSRHMSRLLDDLLDVARISQDKLEVRKQVFDLSTTIPEVIEEISPWYRERQLKLHQEGPPESLVVEGDPARLHQIQVNLLMNAAKYTPAGGEVWYSLKREGTQATISVRDNGIGLPPDLLNRVFDLFFQSTKPADLPHSGIGVGLTLVRAIVELHGGTVDAFSDGPGHGTEFVVRLPLSLNLTARESTTTWSAAPLQSVHILLVEDDQDIRTGMVSLLQFDGHRVSAVPDGPAALRLLQTEKPQLALVDIGLTGMDGYDLAREIRRQIPANQLYLVALTGFGQQADRERALAAGFDIHLTKPFQPQDLARILDAIQRNGPLSDRK